VLSYILLHSFYVSLVSVCYLDLVFCTVPAKLHCTFILVRFIYNWSISLNRLFRQYVLFYIFGRPSWPWSCGSWIFFHNYLCNQCLSPLMMWVRIWIRAMCTTLCDKICQWLVTGRWFSPVSSTNKTNRHDINEIVLKVALNTIK
jgi:hypothetical protein